MTSSTASPATTTVTVSVAPPNHDPQITSSALTAGQVATAYQYQVVATDPDGDALTYALSVSPAGMSVSASGLVSWTPSSTGTFAVTVRVTDGHGGSTTQSFNILVSGNGLPPDPSTVAPPLDPTGANSLFASTAFLYAGANPIQTGVVPGTIDLKRVSVLARQGRRRHGGRADRRHDQHRRASRIWTDAQPPRRHVRHGSQRRRPAHRALCEDRIPSRAAPGPDELAGIHDRA